MKNLNKDYLLVIPIINEEKNINGVLEKLQINKIYDYVDIAFIDGGSTDSTIETINKYDFDKKIFYYKNGNKLSGQLSLGYSYFLENNYKGVITMDGNGKDDPVFIQEFLDFLEKGYDFIQGSRFVEGGESINLPFFRELMIKKVHVPIMSFFSTFKYTDTTQGFRGYSRKLLSNDYFNFKISNYKRYQILLLITLIAPKLGYKVIEVPNSRVYDKTRKQTKFNFVTLIIYFFDILFFSIKSVFIKN